MDGFTASPANPHPTGLGSQICSRGLFASTGDDVLLQLIEFLRLVVDHRFDEISN
jgi:hypothetical protein